MDCKKAKQYMSDYKDFRLPKRAAIRLDAHICGCSRCTHEMDILNQTSLHLKVAYPEITAPIGFSSRVMSEISRSSRRPAPMVVPFKLKRLLMPVAVMAASAILIIGLYYEGAFMTVSPAIEEQPQALIEEVPYQNGNVIDAHNVAEDNETAMLPPLVLPEEPADSELTVEAPHKSVDVEDNVAVVENTPVTIDIPAFREKPVDHSLETVSHIQGTNGYTAITDSSFVDIIPLDERIETNKADLTEIPDFSIFMPRDRIINSISVNVFVGRIDEALEHIERIELLYGIVPDMTETNLLGDGTIAMSRSYTIPSKFVNSIVVGMSSIGAASEVKRSSIDITADYKEMIDAHIKLIRELSATGEGVSELKDLISQMMRLDNMARHEVSNIILTIEDKIDF